ncbi:G2 and S phase-expressed protein 1 [Polymixia lowei]
MDRQNNPDFYSLADEKFDFNVSLSPASSGDEKDDEVFVGPFTHKEKCISVGVEAQAKGSISSWFSEGKDPSWSSLTGDNAEAFRKEAHQLAEQLANMVEDGQQKQPVSEETDGITAKSRDELKEDFVQDPGAKLSLFIQPASAVFSPIKRETFLVQDSPMKQLPPAIQQRLLRGSTSGSLGVVACSAKPRLSTSSPVSTAKTQSKMALRSRAGLGTSGVLPSKPAAPTTSNTLATAKKTTKLAPPSKASLGLRRSPSSRTSSRAGSCQDLSDTGSVASDVSDSSLNSSLQGRRSLAPPSKTGLRNLSAGKAPPSQTRRVVDRRNTSSSSSSVSSFNSSLSVSPTGKAKLNTSMNSSMSGRAPANVGRAANPVASRTRRSAIYSKAPELPTAASAAGARRSISTHARKSSEVEQSRPVRSTPIKRTEPSTPLHQTPAKRAMERNSSLPSVSSLSAARPQIGAKANPKPKALVAPTPTGQLKDLRQSGALSSDPRIMKPKRLISAGSMESLTQRPVIPAPELLSTPSAGGTRSLQTKMRRPSALPTPVNRRVSGIPTMTPKTLPRASRPSPSMRPSYCSPEQTAAVTPEEELDVQEHPDTKQEPEPQEVLIELQPAEDTHPQEHGTKTQEANEVLLVDVPAPVLRPEEKLLIDLSNTPDLIRTTSGKPCGGQLIDLSSPLIKWSPEDKKENVKNEAPLINLSF